MAEKYEVIFSPEAEEDLDKILHYLISSYGPNTAEKAFLNIRSKMETVSKMPEAYTRGDANNKNITLEYRYAIAKKKYKIVYTVIHPPKLLRVISIMHVKMSIGTLIERLEEE
ncbi:MAG: plasmid stabilization system protein ParE [Neolewinella sp.]|jgi:plasmid stabilization system protein ParE